MKKVYQGSAFGIGIKNVTNNCDGHHGVMGTYLITAPTFNKVTDISEL